jgi:hypothetical protein
VVRRARAGVDGQVDEEARLLRATSISCLSTTRALAAGLAGVAGAGHGRVAVRLGDMS